MSLHILPCGLIGNLNEQSNRQTLIPISICLIEAGSGLVRDDNPTVLMAPIMVWTLFLFDKKGVALAVTYKCNTDVRMRAQ